MDNSNIISNPEVEVPKTDEMNDADYLNDILMTEKNISSNYSTVVNEASNKELYNSIKKLMDESKDCAREIFDLQFKKGWYRLEKSDVQKINTIHQEYNQKANEL